MASVVTYDGGLRKVTFSFSASGQRHAVRLGRVSMRVAESWKARIEALVSDKLAHCPHNPELAAWLGALDEKMLARLRAVGLADGVGTAVVSLGEFLERAFETLSPKQSTRTFYGHTRRNLEERFGAGRMLGTIATADADDWRAWLLSDQKLSAATVARRVIAARTLWNKAVRWRLVGENPFVGVRGGEQSNEARKVFIPRASIDAIMAAAPSAEWRALIALARYGGLRTPSEPFELRWGDIDFERGTIRVRCPKLEHRGERFASRTIPLFPELQKPLLDLFAAGDAEAEYLFGNWRARRTNVGTHFARIVERAGLKPWPRLLQNLRASRESELMREYDLATVCRWIGNSPAVAARHYATSIDLDADFKRAAGKEYQKAYQTPHADPIQAASDCADPSAERSETAGFDADCGGMAEVGEGNQWALQDLNL